MLSSSAERKELMLFAALIQARAYTVR